MVGEAGGEGVNPGLLPKATPWQSGKLIARFPGARLGFVVEAMFRWFCSTMLE